MPRNHYELSPTALGLFNDCQRCFYLEKNERIYRPRGFFPSLANGMDLAFKQYFDDCRRQGKRPSELGALPAEIQLYNDRSNLRRWQDYRRGLAWSDANGNKFKGALDELLQREERLIVIDHKTRGFPPKKEDHTREYYQHQLDAYTFLLQREGFATENIGFLLAWHPLKALGDGKAQFGTTIYEVPVFPEDAEELFYRALETLAGQEPEASEKCEYCRRDARMMKK